MLKSWIPSSERSLKGQFSTSWLEISGRRWCWSRRSKWPDQLLLETFTDGMNGGGSSECGCISNCSINGELEGSYHQRPATWWHVFPMSWAACLDSFVSSYLLMCPCWCAILSLVGGQSWQSNRASGWAMNFHHIPIPTLLDHTQTQIQNDCTTIAHV
jgi:hypothetical protein